MKHITLSIPENYFDFYMELFKKLESVEIKEVSTDDEDFSIPEEHQKIILERIRNTPKEQYQSWDKIKNKIQL